MIRYSAAAFALKVFSLNALTRRFYRLIGNHFGAKNRHQVADLPIRVNRGDLIVELCRKYHALNNGDKLLEVGTGWMHWYSLYLRIFYECRITALDIWDNRQFSALKAGFGKLAERHKETPISETASNNLAVISRAASFAELYREIGFQYVIEPRGSLDQFADQSFDCILSMHVLEHVPAKYVNDLIGNMYRTLKPGKFTIHQIGIDDHLAHYDRKASQKQYLKYSDRTWKALFENEVQYFNRLQMSEWLNAFKNAGFTLEEKLVEATDIATLKIAPRFAGYSHEDLSCTILTLVYRKPI
jgi:cyclopropane fatty-acyl-phospholipid synthase-like methyltransferase